MKKNRKVKVFIAMSGGVDSSVAAFLLQKQGYEVVGIFMKLWQEKGKGFENKCCSVDSFKSAQAVCDHLGIRLYTVNLKTLFKEKIVDPFLHDYEYGLTPNPCVQCNKHIKFGELLKRVRKMGGDYLATGHYVKMTNVKCQMTNQIPMSKSKCPITHKLLIAKDINKDQSYFLYNLGQKELKHLLFPVGGYTKSQVREIAKKNKLPVYDRKESQEVCFVPNNGLERFLKKHLKLRPGKIMTTEGKEVGEHKGLALYTIGQRRGVGIGGIGPFYVVKKDYKKNQLIVVDKKHVKELNSSELVCKNVNWVFGGAPNVPLKCRARIRYQGGLVLCEVNRPASTRSNRGEQTGKQINRWVVKFREPIKAVAAGQSVVFYKGQEVLGGGEIVQGRVRAS